MLRAQTEKGNDQEQEAKVNRWKLPKFEGRAAAVKMPSTGPVQPSKL